MPRVKTEQSEPLLLNKTDLCKSLAISTTAFDKWGVKPYKKQGRQSLYSVADVVANRVGNERDKHKPMEGEDPDKELTIDYQRFRLTKAQADGQELKNEKERKEVVDVSFNTFVLSKMAAQVAPQLDQIPLRLKRKYPQLEEYMLDFIKSEVIKSMNVVSELAESVESLLDEYLASADQ
ncbi:DNA packaging protein [Parashewanella curva]|uniref:DNA packaging protein n=1 Tax=Parashewanella curva TaxID=2338552 RepID=A0A3L8Q004_9GAMM|nr:terminase small subunit [Parashewanella curva]RLV60997.1 DNA packaging protein [Parashewanella curva]